MQMIERPSHQFPRLQRQRMLPLGKSALQPGHRVLEDDLAIPDDDGARSAKHALYRMTQRAVGHNVIRHQKDETRVDHRIAGFTNRFRVGERDRRRVIAICDEMIDKPNYDLARRRESFKGRMMTEKRFVVGARQNNELGWKSGRNSRHIAGREKRRQAVLEKISNVMITPDGNQQFSRLWGRT